MKDSKQMERICTYHAKLLSEVFGVKNGCQPMLRLVKPLVVTVFACLVTSGLAGDKPATAGKPNVVFIMTDDQGYGDLSIHGNPIVKTPHIDALAKESVRLDDYHVSPNCAPTRAALLTGRWANRTGVWHTFMSHSLLRENEITIGQIFKDGGYATGMFGKWHLGDNYPFRPEDRGFTEVLRHGGGGVGQTPDYWDNAYFDDTYFHNKVPEKTRGYCTDVYFDYAKKFIEAQVAKKKPFFAYISTNAPHGPLHAPLEYAQPYIDAGVRNSTAHFFGMITNIDHNVGEMRKWLAERGLAENTIFIFTTDNGTYYGRGVYDGGMRDGKGSPYDGGHRVPFFIRWPKGNLAGGRMVHEITAHVDVVPTLIDLCDVPAPAGVKFDGVSIRPLLDDKVDGDWPDRILVTDNQKQPIPRKWKRSAVMTNRWRLVNENALYDIKADPKQEKNIIDQHPQVAQRLRGFYNDWWDEISPTFGLVSRIRVGNKAENPSRLTAFDWSGKGIPWSQQKIRTPREGAKQGGFWSLIVEQSGNYEIELRRWPNEGKVAGTAITAEIPAGAPVPGPGAFRIHPGVAISASVAKITIGGQTKEMEIPEGAPSVTFPIKLEAGETELEATFHGNSGQSKGAYYVYVRKL